MDKCFKIIKSNPLFNNINDEGFNLMINCLQGKVKSYPKTHIILLADSLVDTIGIVLTGTVQIISEDSDGRQNLLAELHKGELFGEVFACAGVTHSPVTVVATQAATVLHLKYSKLITSCSKACEFHQRLIENMLQIIAQKNLMLNKKLEILSKRTTKDRVLLFLQWQCKASKSCTITYNREELAAYLCVDRSALSAELSRMQQEGIIKYNKNNFEIL